MIFSSIFLHAVTVSHVLHLDVVRSQIELKLKVKTEFPYVCYNAEQPIAIPIYTVLPYCVIGCDVTSGKHHVMKSSRSSPSFLVLCVNVN